MDECSSVSREINILVPEYQRNVLEFEGRWKQMQPELWDGKSIFIEKNCFETGRDKLQYFHDHYNL